MLRPEISQSWRRAELAGLVASMHRLTHEEVDRRSRLVQTATPVLDSIADNLTGTTFTVVLADRDARIVDRRFGQAGLADHLDELGIILGRQFTEENTGTNDRDGARAAPRRGRPARTPSGRRHHPRRHPHRLRASTAARSLAPIEQIEHDAIVRALRACGGNKVYAADRLGMSRSTLYRRIRTLGVSC